MENNDLSSISTRELIAELTNRPGVIVDHVDPYKDRIFSVNGPALMLTVVD